MDEHEVPASLAEGCPAEGCLGSKRSGAPSDCVTKD
jgi:hypothetical protein